MDAARNASAYWRFLLFTNAAVAIGYLIYRACRDFLPYPYIHLLVNYHFGFARRALIGAIVSLFVDRVPYWLPFAMGTVALAVAFGLFMLLFVRRYGFRNDTMPLLALTAGSPFFFKEFIAQLGYFDIYGCIFAILLLLVKPRSSAYVVFAAVGCGFLILMHHLQILLYVPAAAAIVLIRYFLARQTPIKSPEVILAAVFLIALFGAFAYLQFYGSVKATVEEFDAFVLSRADPRAPVDKWLVFRGAWFRTIQDEYRDTLGTLPMNLIRLPLYAFLLFLQVPLARYFKNCVAAIANDNQRYLVCAALAGITLAYVIIFATVNDYARWLGNWFVCIVLVMFAVKGLPVGRPVDPIPLHEPKTFWAAAILSWFPKADF